MSPLLLDLFCGAGGAAMGYARAGFEIVGVDVAPQPRYPFEFVRADALEFDLEADVVHASPPCQAYSSTRTLHDATYPDLVPVVRDLLRASGLPYILENVDRSPLRKQATFDEPDVSGVLLCGSSFGLPIRRHRRFESNLPLTGLACRHGPNPIDVTGGGRSVKRRTDGGGGRTRKPWDLAEARAALGMDWGTRAELNQAIPPAYTTFLGEQVLAILGEEVVSNTYRNRP